MQDAQDEQLRGKRRVEMPDAAKVRKLVEHLRSQGFAVVTQIDGPYCHMGATICDIIAQRKLTQRGAAAILRIDQPKVSALMRGRLEGFSSERLFRFLNALGRDVEIVIRPKRPGTKRGKTRVLVGQV